MLDRAIEVCKMPISALNALFAGLTNRRSLPKGRDPLSGGSVTQFSAFGMRPASQALPQLKGFFFWPTVWIAEYARVNQRNGGN